MINHHSSGQRRQQNEVYLLEKDAYLLCLHVKPATVFCGVIIFVSIVAVRFLRSANAENNRLGFELRLTQINFFCPGHR